MSTGWKNKVVRNFDRGTQAYDAHTDLQQRVAAHLSHDLPKDNVDDILEIGCGTGHLTKHLLDLYQDARLIHVTDISESMLDKARSKIQDPEIFWSVMDGEYPDTDRQYDLIVANMVFQWFEDAPAALDKLQSLLKPGGQIYYTLPGRESFKEWREVLSALNLLSGVLPFQSLPGIFKEEDLTHIYDDAFHFLSSLKKMGASQAVSGYKPMDFGQMKQACNHFDQAYAGRVTWHILYGRLKKEEKA